MNAELLDWLLESDEPWTRYRTLVDLMDRSEDDSEVEVARKEMIANPGIQGLMAAAKWGQRPLKRHNDASHPIYSFSILADFGVRADDEGMCPGIQALIAHQSHEGAFQTLVNIPKAFGGTGEDMWTWQLCDAPTVLYSLLTMGLGSDTRVQRAVDHLVALVEDNGWHCAGAPTFGSKFKGPGRRSDPCPIVNVHALKALSRVPHMIDSQSARIGVEMLLWHWEHQEERKLYLFGIGTDFRKLKYPFVWYDILHVVDVLSRFPFVYHDQRFREMVDTITEQADKEGHYTANSMYRAWKGWSFADKKNPSPWLTFLVLRILKRRGN